MSLWYQRDQHHRLENNLATQLLLKKQRRQISTPVTNLVTRKTVVSVETYTVSGIYWIKYREHLDLILYWVSIVVPNEKQNTLKLQKIKILETLAWFNYRRLQLIPNNKELPLSLSKRCCFQKGCCIGKLLQCSLNMQNIYLGVWKKVKFVMEYHWWSL